MSHVAVTVKRNGNCNSKTDGSNNYSNCNNNNAARRTLSKTFLPDPNAQLAETNKARVQRTDKIGKLTT